MANKFDSINLQQNPDRIREIDFTQLVGERPDISDWDNTFNKLQELHNRFYRYNPVTLQGSLQNINNYFVEVVNWLQGRVPLANFIGLPQISGWKSLDLNIYNQFRDTWIPNMESNLNNDQSFLMLQQVDSQIRSELQKLGSIKADNELQGVIKNFEKKVSDIQNQLNASIKDREQKAVATIRNAQAIRDWVEYYQKVENDYAILIEGSHKLQAPYKTITGDDGKCHRIVRWPIAKKELKGGTSIESFKMGEATKRLLWFTALAIVVALPSLLALFNYSEILGLPNPFHIDISNNHDITLQLIEKLKFLPIVLVIVFGYAFSNKNYRILSNLREQYRHRRTVASTLQGIIVDIDESGKNTDIRVKLTEVGAKAMFDLKTIGHLTKRDSESGPMAEIVQTILPGGKS